MNWATCRSLVWGYGE